MTSAVAYPLAKALAYATLSVFVVACAAGDDSPKNAPTQTGDSGGSAAAKPSGPPAQVIIEVPGGEVVATVEVVRTQSKIRRGLMYRTFLPTNAGMLFLFDREKIQSFWMKNTLISLDMIFIRADMTVAGVKANTPPRTLDSQRIDKPSQYVLEVNAGWAANNNVAAGAKVRFKNVGDVPKGVPMTEVADN